MDKDAPDGVFWKAGSSLFVLFDLLEEVSVVHILHHDAKVVGFNESFLEGNDVLVLHGSEDAHLRQCILLLFVGEGLHLHLLQCILLSVSESLRYVYARVGSFTCVSCCLPSFDRIWKFLRVIET